LRRDPTAAWPESRALTPIIDLTDVRIGSLRFGDPLEAAAWLGRPARFIWRGKDACTLEYMQGGCQLEFSDGAFEYLAFLLGPDPYVPDPPPRQYARPRVRGTFEIELTPAAGEGVLADLLGPVESADRDAYETILVWNRRGVTLEFEIDEHGALKRFNAFPEKR
jgi:hypothetical protein